MENKLKIKFKNSCFTSINIGHHSRPIIAMCLFTLLFLFINVSTVTAQTQKRQMVYSSISVKDALEQIKIRTGYSMWFNVNDVNLEKYVSLDFRDKNINQLMSMVLKGQPLTYEISGTVIQIYPKTKISKKNNGNKRTHILTGVVTDATDGMPLIGCNVRVANKDAAAITDREGRFHIEVTSGDEIQFSYIGYETMQKAAGDNSTMNIQLSSSSVALNDVVVTGYQVLKKFNVTGAVNTIDSKKIDLRSSNSLQGILEGAVPGLTVYNNEYRIRGGASMRAGNKPLFIVDDFEVEELPENMDNVESITVLKDASAAAIWGSRAANGVIVITTKRGKADQFKISYSGNMKFSSQPDFSDLHRANSEDIVDYDKAAFLGGYYFPGYFSYSKNGYSLSQEILNDYLPASGNIGDVTAEQLQAMNTRLAQLAKNNNRKQIEDNLLRSAFEQHQLISISGGTDRINYYLSTSYISGHSSYKGDNEESVNINSRTSYKIAPFITLRTDINATFTNNNNGYTSLASDIYNMYPFQMLLDEKGNRVADYSGFNHDYSKTMVNDYGYYDQGLNLLDEIDLANNKTKGVNYKARIGTDFKIIDGLNFSVDYQYERAQSTTKNVISKKSYEGRTLINSMASLNDNSKLVYNIPNGDILDHQQSTTDAWILKFGTTLNKYFGANREHYVNAVAGFEMRSRHNYSDRYRKLGYDDQLLSWQPIDAVTLQKGINWWNNDTNRYYSTYYDGFSDVLNKELSYFLSTVYTYDNRYTLSASLRIDKSNLFGASEKYRRNPIWALGANWNIKNEKFFHSNVISTLLLRASWGLTGNFDRSGSTTPVMVGRRLYLPAVGDYVTRLTTPPNPKLRWERNRSTNISIDLGLFDRINTTLTYYNNYCYDLLGSTKLDPTTGYASATINAADMKNRGFELQLNADVIKTRDFSWDINWIFSYNYNKIIHNKISDSDPQFDRISGTVRFVEGYAREALWSYRWAGLDSNGEPQVYDKDGKKVYDISKFGAEDLVYSGTYQPKYNGSISTGLRYKNLQAHFLFTYNLGQVFRSEYPSMNPYATSPSLSDKIGKRWRKAGDENTTDIACIPKMSDYWAKTSYRENAVMSSSNSIRKGDMIRLREILLNYELPQAWLRHFYVHRLSLTAQFNNIALWTRNSEKYDPEAVNPITGSMSLSQPFSFTAGIKIDF